MERRTHGSAFQFLYPQSTRLEKDLSASSHHADPGFTDRIRPFISRHLMSGIKRPHVCVVGAGVAGLRCADILLQQGIKVTILEGRDRIGGRLWQGNINGVDVDLGPNWIHGTVNNPILDICEATNTKTFSWDGRQTIFDREGHPLSNNLAERLSRDAWTIIGDAMAFSNQSSSSIPSTRSLYDHFREKVSELKPLTDGTTFADQDRETMLLISEMWGAFVGCPIQRQSLKFFFLEECLDGENLFVADTYKKVLDQIADPALRQAEIHYDTIVDKIVSHSDTSQQRVSVETSKGDSFSFDEVVVTAPLGCLKRNHKTMFTPTLPLRISNAIHNIGYGNLDKVYLFFETAWWDTPSSLSTSAEPDSKAPSQTTPNVPVTAAPLHPKSSAGDIDVLTHYAGFTQFVSPKYAFSTNPEAWNQECVNMASLPAPNAHPSLLFYVFGPTSDHLASIVAEAGGDPSSSRAQKRITEFLRPYFALLPNYNPSSPEHQPARTLFTNWTSDPLAGYGSYCNFQIGLEHGDEDVEAMREGCPERGVWFAGEHTAPFVAVGTVTGAYWAGEGVARRIGRMFGLESGVDVEAKI